MESSQKKSMFSQVVEFAGRKKAFYVASVVFSIVSVLCGVIPYFIIGDMAGKLLGGERCLSIYTTDCMILTGLWVMHALFFGLSTYCSHKGTFAVLASIRRQLTEKLSRMPLGDVLERGSGEYKSLIIERVDSMESIFAHVIPEVFGNLVGAAVVMLAMLILDWRMGIASLAVIPIALFFMAHMMKGANEWYGEVFQKTGTLNKTAVEYINGIEVIKVYGQTKQSYGRFVTAAKEAADVFIRMMRKFNLDQNVSFAVLPSALIVLLPVGIGLMMNGSLTLTKFVLLCILSLGEMQPLLNAYSYSEDIRMANSVINSVADVLSKPEMNRPERLTKEIKGGDICFQNVCFSYGDKEVLHDISLTFQAGCVNALVGPSGSGKSTITKLIISFYDPQNGTITLGGVDVRDIPLDEISKRIAYVSQDNYLFDMSIMENIRLGRRDAPDEEVIQAAKDTGIHEFILSLPDGYHTRTGESGGHLSGGERQRITIARAMLKGADIVILDEASSYSDPENEAIVQEALSRLLIGKTVIVVAHRLSTIADADRIYLINQGKLEAQGNQDELLKKSELYRRMWQAHSRVRDKAGEEN